MKRNTVWLILNCLMIATLILASCAQSVTEEEEAAPTPQVTGETIVVNSTADSGSGTLRQALLDAQSGDIITFDPAVFPPSAPATIYLSSSLPPITQGNLTIDASNAGVIMDGTDAQGEWVVGLEITSAGNTIQGLQIINFSGAGILLNEQAQHNIIGGDRGIGSGPIGQGNLSSGNSDGVGLFGACYNLIAGNLIGTDATATDAFGNEHPGIFIQNDASHNIIGPGNIIAYNGDHGIDVRSTSSIGNTITQNTIHDNARSGINMPEGSIATLLPPLILNHDLEAGKVDGAARPNCTIEIFSDRGNEGEVYEGRTTANGTGAFTFNKDVSFTGPHLTATATDADGNTSEFSVSTTRTRESSSFKREIICPKPNSSPSGQANSKTIALEACGTAFVHWTWGRSLTAKFSQLA